MSSMPQPPRLASIHNTCHSRSLVRISAGHEGRDNHQMTVTTPHIVSCTTSYRLRPVRVPSQLKTLGALERPQWIRYLACLSQRSYPPLSRRSSVAVSCTPCALSFGGYVRAVTRGSSSADCEGIHPQWRNLTASMQVLCRLERHVSRR